MIFQVHTIGCVWKTPFRKSSHIFDNEILPTGYTIYHKDRNSHGGGVLKAIKGQSYL